MFKTLYKTTISDINYGGHMGNERYLLLFQQARIDFFKSLNLSEANVGEGIGTIQKDAHLFYKSEVFLGDILIVNIKNIELNKLELVFTYLVEKEDGTVVVEGTTSILAYDYSQKKIKRFPKDLINKIETLKNGNKI